MGYWASGFMLIIRLVKKDRPRLVVFYVSVRYKSKLVFESLYFLKTGICDFPKTKHEN